MTTVTVTADTPTKPVTWCKDSSITAGRYELADGTKVLVRQSKSGKFYACQRIDGRWSYTPGLIWRLSAEMAKQAG